MNPSYYELEDTDNDSVNKFLSGLVENAVTQVETSACVEIGEVIRIQLCGVTYLQTVPLLGEICDPYSDVIS